MQYSQYGQDIFIASQYPEGFCGFFIEIGAHDGISFSNTKRLEELGWTGICIEPIPEVFSRLEKNRTCTTICCAISKTLGVADFYRNEGYTEMLSGLVDDFHPMHKQRLDRENKTYSANTKIIQVATRPLSEIFPQGTIHYLSIDVEGAEMSVLQSIDWTATHIDFISVEDNYNDTTMKSFLHSKGFSFVKSIGCDRIYKNSSLK